jgi:hypothetical protein
MRQVERSSDLPKTLLQLPQMLSAHIGDVVARPRIPNLLRLDPKDLRSLRVVAERPQILLERHALLLDEAHRVPRRLLVLPKDRHLVLVDDRPDALEKEKPIVQVGID